MLNEKTAIIKIYVKKVCIGKLEGQPGEVYENTPEFMKEVIEMINTDRVHDGLEQLRPSQTVGAVMMICYN